ncbi:MAG: hypothetical protein K2P67_12095 [Gallionellaceae bacterium]|nr:hypothetical protein [Gallionellaceae bacterium]
MALSVGKKRLILGGALLLTLATSAWLGMGQAGDKADVAELAKPASAKLGAAPRRTASVSSLPILAKARAESEQEDESEPEATDAFKPHSWFVAPPPPRPVKAEVVVPVPPSLPFTYLGTVQDGERRIVFLAKGERLYTVSKGEIFDGQYRLEDEGRGRIELVYLPLNAKQILVTKGVS